MAATDPRQTPLRRYVTRREFLKRAGWTSAGMTALTVGAGRGRPAAQPAAPYPDWIPASPKPPKRGGILTRASAWDPPVIDPRLTQSIGLFQFAGLTSNRLLRHAFTDEAAGYSDLSLKGDLVESWQGSPDQRVWTFKLRRGVKWQNVSPAPSGMARRPSPSCGSISSRAADATRGRGTSRDRSWHDLRLVAIDVLQGRRR